MRLDPVPDAVGCRIPAFHIRRSTVGVWGDDPLDLPACDSNLHLRRPGIRRSKAVDNKPKRRWYSPREPNSVRDFQFDWRRYETLSNVQFEQIEQGTQRTQELIAFSRPNRGFWMFRKGFLCQPNPRIVRAHC